MFLLIIIGVIALFVGPNLWVNYVMKKHHRHLEGMPGTGGEFAQHLLNQFQLDKVTLQQGGSHDNYYSPDNNLISLSSDNYSGKSLTALAVAAHEVGHALQFQRQEPVSFLRRKYLPKAYLIQKIGFTILLLMPIITMIVKTPLLAVVTILVGVFTLLLSVLMYVAILPEEFDASFNKALPILEQGGYIPPVYLPAVKQVLKAAALTYVAAALADILRLWRWLSLVR